MEKFAEYGFNKSHSAAYALVSYQTAWLKRHYPAEFMAAMLSSDMDNTDKVVGFLDEVRNLGLTVLPPRVNASAYMFEAVQRRHDPVRPGRDQGRRPGRMRSGRGRARSAVVRMNRCWISACASNRASSTGARSKR